MLHLDYDKAITGTILKSEFNSWAESIREDFLNTVKIKKSTGDLLNFLIPNAEDTERLHRLIKNFSQNKRRSENRKQDLHILSSGLSEKYDIEAIYEIQEGLCYYTGSP